MYYLFLLILFFVLTVAVTLSAICQVLSTHCNTHTHTHTHSHTCTLKQIDDSNKTNPCATWELGKEKIKLWPHATVKKRMLQNKKGGNY